MEVRIESIYIELCLHGVRSSRGNEPYHGGSPESFMRNMIILTNCSPHVHKLQPCAHKFQPRTYKLKLLLVMRAQPLTIRGQACHSSVNSFTESLRRYRTEVCSVLAAAGTQTLVSGCKHFDCQPQQPRTPETAARGSSLPSTV